MMMMGKKMPKEMMVDEDVEAPNGAMGGKLLALQKFLDSIGEIVGDDIKPYIEEAKQSMHLMHEQEEGDDLGVEEAEEGMEVPEKEGIDIKFGMKGKKDPMIEEEEEEDGLPKKGFLAILSKKLKK